MSANDTIMIPLSKVENDPRDGGLRPPMVDTEGFARIKNSMQQYGLLHAITVRHDKEAGKFYLIDGHQRTECARQLGWDQIAANVRTIEAEDIPVLQIVANLAKVETSKMQYAKALQRIITGPKFQGCSKQQIMAALGLKETESWFNDQLRLNNLIDDIQKMVDGGLIKASNAYYLAKLPEEEQIDFVDFAKEDLTPIFMDRINTRLAELKAAAKGQKVEDQDPLKLAKGRTLGDHKKKYETLEQDFANCQDPERKLILTGMLGYAQWSLSIDEETLARKKAEREAQEAKRQEKANARKAVLDSVRDQIKGLNPSDIKEVVVQTIK